MELLQRISAYLIIPYFFGYKTDFFPKQSKSSRSILFDGSRSLALFRKGRIDIAKFHRTDLVIEVIPEGRKPRLIAGKIR